jgi:glycosyltransferase involved in cell wall biosynthesis
VSGIVLDVQALQSPAYARRGIGRYVTDLARTLEREHAGVVGTYAWNDRLAFGGPLAELDAELRLGRRLVPSSALRGDTVDVLHVPAPFAPLQRADDEAIAYGDWAVPVRARRLVLTVHDLIPWRHPEMYLADARDLARYHHRLVMLLTADAIVADSEATARDVIELAGVAAERVVVGGAGVGERFVPAARPRAELLADLGGVLPTGTDGFVLVVGAPDWRKNLDGALAAYAMLPAEVRDAHPIVLAAPLHADDRSAVGWLAAELDIVGRVIAPGFVDDDSLVRLYQAASVVVVPSRIEGFGLPVVEARACGARTICSNTSSLVEVLPEPAARFDPDRPADIARCLLAALTDPGYQALLDAAPDSPYSWTMTAARTVAAYGSPRPARAARRARGLAATTITTASNTTTITTTTIGVVTHLPPAASGVADHSERLVAALDALPGVRVEAFNPAVPHRSARAPGVTVHHLAALHERWASGALDHVLYCVGNGTMHRPLVDALRTVPGAVFLHDVRVPILLGRDVDDAGSPRPFAERATLVLVQSAHAVQMLHDEAGLAGVDVGPHPCWNAGTTERILDTDGAPWVVSAGIAHEAKQTDRFVAAVRPLVAAGVARAAIVGDGGPRFVSDGDGIVTVGHVDDHAFDTWLRRATIAVQLRAGTNGESSGVVAHAMARGVPLVVTDIGAMSEVPDAAAVKVPVDVTPDALARVIGSLLADRDRLASMRAAGLAFAARETTAAQARRVLAALTATRVAG